MGDINQHFTFSQRVIKFQLTLGIACTVMVLLVTNNLNDMLSALTGVILVIIPTLMYAFIAFRKGVIAYPVVALKRHQMAMLLRFVTNLVCFAAVVILYRQCNFPLLLLAYCVTLSGYWFSLIKK